MPRIETVDELFENRNWSGQTWELGQTGVPPHVPQVWRYQASRAPLTIEDHEDFEIDGGYVSLYGNGLRLIDCKRFTLRNLSIRLGSEGLSAQDYADYGRPAPLDLYDCRRGRVEKSHFGWSLDENISVVSSKKIRIVECITSEPLDNPKDSSGQPFDPGEPDHAFTALVRGSIEVRIHRCLLSGGRYRNPQLSRKGKHGADLSVRSCIVFDFVDGGATFNSNRKSGDREYRIRDNYFVYSGDPDDATPISIEKPDGGDLELTVERNKLWTWGTGSRESQSALPRWDNERRKVIDPDESHNRLDYTLIEGEPELSYEDVLRNAGQGRREDEPFKHDAHELSPTFRGLLDSERESRLWPMYEGSIQ